MDEHLVVDGPVVHLNADIADINLNGIGWWTEKHNRYATLEAIETLRGQPTVAGLALNARTKRFIKQHFYLHLPVGLRAALYFAYRYFLQLGFLDGWPGIVFATLQAGWYRFLVDVKVYELQSVMRRRDQSLAEAVRAEHGIIL